MTLRAIIQYSHLIAFCPNGAAQQSPGLACFSPTPGWDKNAETTPQGLRNPCSVEISIYCNAFGVEFADGYNLCDASYGIPKTKMPVVWATTSARRGERLNTGIGIECLNSKAHR